MSILPSAEETDIGGGKFRREEADEDMYQASRGELMALPVRDVVQLLTTDVDVLLPREDKGRVEREEEDETRVNNMGEGRGAEGSLVEGRTGDRGGSKGEV